VQEPERHSHVAPSDGTTAGSEPPDEALDFILARPRLLTVVQGRWSRPVTAVVAGAGFGKTTLLHQATAAGGPDEHVDVMLRIEPGDTSAVRLASRLLGALAVESSMLASEDELLDLVVDELWARAPTPVCLVLDDLHEIAPDSRGILLLRETHKAAEVINMIDQTVAAPFRPFGIAVPAQIRSHDMEMRLQFPRDRIPVAAMVEPAMNQDQGSRGFITPIGIVQPQSLRLVKARCRFHRWVFLADVARYFGANPNARSKRFT